MNDAARSIDPVRTSLGEALKVHGPLKIPDFQRDYSWKPERVRKLFEDLNSAMIRRKASYFLGTIVVTAGRPLRVIDGQQRLATTCIFLAAVRDALYGLGKDADADRLHEEYVLPYDRQQKENVPSLTMNTDDRAYMRARVLDKPKDRGEPPTPRSHSHRLINRAAEIAAERVRQIMGSADSPSRKVEATDAWVNYIEENTLLVMLITQSRAGAYEIYKTMNDRAQRTTPADMIKSHLFEQADDGIDEAQAKWSSMRAAVEGLGSSGDDDPLLVYLHHAAVVTNGPINREDIFAVMEEKVVGRTASLAFLADLDRLANDYSAIQTPTHPKWAAPYDHRVRKYVEYISHQLGMSFIRPLMLAVASRFSPKETNRAFQMLVCWVIRLLVVGGSRSGTVETALGNAALAINKNEVMTAKQLFDKAGHVIPTDIRFFNSFCFKTLQSKKQIRFLLRELEGEVRIGSSDPLLEPVDDVSRLNLEHVLPKNPEATGWDYYSEDERKSYRWRLGNLILLKADDNGASNDKPFSEKRPVIEKSKYIRLTGDVIERTDDHPDRWTTDDIKARQKRLAELAKVRWPRNPKGGK